LFGLILSNSTLALTSSLEAQIQHVNELINTNFEATSADSILSMFSLARRTLSNRGLVYKMLSDEKKTTNMLGHIDDSHGRSNDFAKHVWGYKIYMKILGKKRRILRCQF
jgi:hypothetical protein